MLAVMNAPLTRRQLLCLCGSLPLGACSVPYLAPVATQAAPAPNNVALRAPRIGQQWTYGKYNVFNSQLLETEHHSVTAIAPEVVVARRSVSGLVLPSERHRVWGALLQDPVWDHVQVFEQPVPLWPNALTPEAREIINTRYTSDSGSFLYWVQVLSTVATWERVSLPIGSFDCWRIERLIRLAHPDVTRLETLRRDTLWLAPDVGRWVVREISGQYRLPGRKSPVLLEDRVRWELQAWQ